MAVQGLQVAEPARAVPQCPRHLHRLARRGYPSYGQGLGSRGVNRPGGEMESPRRCPWEMERSRSGGRDLGSR